jgi:hypothetical protein
MPRRNGGSRLGAVGGWGNLAVPLRRRRNIKEAQSQCLWTWLDVTDHAECRKMSFGQDAVADG